jgi:hypothetical protein
MKNVVICPNCGSENPFYKYTCVSCKGYLRERIFNLDLWQLIGMLIESPVKAFNRIIQSEHKNFVLFIAVLFSVKAFVDSRFISILLTGENGLRLSLLPTLLIAAAAGYIVIWICTLILFMVNKSSGLKSRLRDNNAVLVYSLIPYAFGLVILFPIELITFGQYLFADNPSPFMLKPTIAFALLAFEGLLILWGMFLSITGIYSLSRSMSYALIAGIIFNIFLFGFMYFISIILFV